jgi:hypothetical protein
MATESVGLAIFFNTMKLHEVYKEDSVSGLQQQIKRLIRLEVYDFNSLQADIVSSNVHASLSVAIGDVYASSWSTIREFQK